MLQRYMSMAYSAGKQPQDLTDVRVNITAFEFDRVNNEAILALKYTLKKHLRKQTGNIVCREKIKADSPDEFAAAMNTAVRKAAERLADAAEKFI